MSNRCATRKFDGLAFALLALWSAGVLHADSLEEEASWTLLGDDTVAQFLEEGLKEQGTAEKEIQALLESYHNTAGQNGIDRLDAFTVVVRQAVSELEARIDEVLGDPTQTGNDPFVGTAAQLRDQIRLWVGRSLVRDRLFDEALPLLQPLDTEDCIEPAMLLFYRGVCNHALLNKDDAIDDLTKLLENKDNIPRRFARTAEMMLADIEPVKEDSLDEISRLMSDVSRRLDLGRSNDDVVEREQAIIEKLDKMIKKMEDQQKQQQQQQQAQAQSGGNGGQSRPMQDSQIAGGGGPGDVDRRDLGEREGWGDLPPAQRKETLQDISQDLPTHYREAIEAYFRKLATEKP